MNPGYHPAGDENLTGQLHDLVILFSGRLPRRSGRRGAPGRPPHVTGRTSSRHLVAAPMRQPRATLPKRKRDSRPCEFRSAIASEHSKPACRPARKAGRK